MSWMTKMLLRCPFHAQRSMYTTRKARKSISHLRIEMLAKLSKNTTIKISLLRREIHG
jgi:hypothetical protein